jgi:RsiW-degrading membrane proteinase PrsW (M82 family)
VPAEQTEQILGERMVTLEMGAPAVRRFSVSIVKRTWFQVLVIGTVLFFVVHGAFLVTDNSNFVPTLLFLGAFVVPMSFVLYVYEREPARDIPLALLAVSFLWGGIVATVVAGVIEYHTLRALGPLELFGVGFIEESTKLFVPIILLVVASHYRSEAHGLVFGVAAGMGFAALESMGYGFTSLMRNQGDIRDAESVLLVRGLLSPAGHAAWTGLVCAVLWRERAKFGRFRMNLPVLGAFTAAVLLHALWDILDSLSGPTFIDAAGIELLSAAVALVSLRLLYQMVVEAAQNAPPMRLRPPTRIALPPVTALDIRDRAA